METVLTKPIHQYAYSTSSYKGKLMPYTIVGCMVGMIITYNNQFVVHIGISKRNLADDVNKAVGYNLAFDRAYDPSIKYKIHCNRNSMPERLWKLQIAKFAYKCSRYYPGYPVLFPMGVKFTEYPTRCPYTS